MEYNGFKIGDLDSLENKIFSTQKTVYNAPERAVEMLTIPGRNGAIALDQGRWENQPVTYRCGCYAESDEKFAERIASFRSKLLLKTSYEILTDSYNPDEFRLGLYRSGLEADTVSRNHAGEFDVEFDCKPQRFLVSGNVPKPIGTWGATKRLSGEMVTFESDGSDGFKSLVADIEPVQDLNGYSKPWPGGAGKNKLYIAPQTLTSNGITWTVNADGTVTAKGTLTSSNSAVYINATAPTGSYKFNGSGTGSSNTTYYAQIVDGSTWYDPDYGNNDKDVTISSSNVRLYINTRVSPPSGGITFKPMLRASGTSADFEPYENLCPISGWDSVEVVVSPTTSAEDGTTHTATFDETVYGGTVDLVSGVISSELAKLTIDGSSGLRLVRSGTSNSLFAYEPITAKQFAEQTLPTDLLANYLAADTAYNAWRNETPLVALHTSGNTLWFRLPGIKTLAEAQTYLASNPLEVVYPLRTAEELQTSPQTINALEGINNVWADSGAVTVEYGEAASMLFNGTGYPAKPLIVITGNGTVGVGEHLITVAGATSPVYIDCETMEIYTESGGIISGASSLVSFNTNEFPTLEAGQNGVSVGSGISSVVITPRWWRL